MVVDSCCIAYSNIVVWEEEEEEEEGRDEYRSLVKEGIEERELCVWRYCVWRH